MSNTHHFHAIDKPKMLEQQRRQMPPMQFNIGISGFFKQRLHLQLKHTIQKMLKDQALSLRTALSANLLIKPSALLINSQYIQHDERPLLVNLAVHLEQKALMSTLAEPEQSAPADVEKDTFLLRM